MAVSLPKRDELDLVIREILMYPLVGAMVERGIELPAETPAEAEIGRAQ